MAMPPLSVIILTKNSAATLPMVLQRIQWAAEVLVIDDSSEDATRLIASYFSNVRVVVRALLNFADQRHWGDQTAGNRWVLHLDSDEILLSELEAELQEFQNLAQPPCEAYAIGFRHHFMGKWLRHGGFYPDCKLRLYNKDRCRWKGELHEQLTGFKTQGRLTHDLEHHTDLTLRSRLRKIRRYAVLEAAQRIRYGHHPSWWHFVYRPFRLFAGKMFWRLGIIDGWRGWLWYLCMAWEELQIARQMQIQIRQRQGV